MEILFIYYYLFHGVYSRSPLFTSSCLRLWKLQLYLSLALDSKISVIYPVVSINQSAAHLGQEISWKVQTKEDGRLTELSTVLDVSYLFWEAVYVSCILLFFPPFYQSTVFSFRIDPTVPISPPPSPVQSYTAQAMESFHPMLSNLSSVLLSVDVIMPYFGQALKNLRLHTEARTSFIT